MHPHMPLALLGSLGGPDLLVIGLFALLIFGKRLPEVGKNLGKTIVEFKKGLNGKALAVDDESAIVDDAPQAAAPLPPAANVRRLQSSGRVSVSPVQSKNMQE